MKMYTKEQVIELLKQQREECVFEYELRGTESKAKGHILNAPEPQYPVPIQAIPVERVKEVVDILSGHIDRIKEQQASPNKMYIEGIYYCLGAISLKLLSDGK